jgi:hypothetical protein
MFNYRILYNKIPLISDKALENTKAARIEELFSNP